MARFLEKRNILALVLVPLGVPLMFFIFFLYSALLTKPADYLRSDLGWEGPWSAILIDIVGVVILLVITALLFRSRIPDLAKAIISILPTIALLLVAMDRRWLLVSYIIDVGLVLAILLYYWKSKRPWFFYYATILTALFLLAMEIFQIEI